MPPRVRKTTAPRWLDVDELAAWRAFMDIARGLPDALDSHLQQDAGLSFLEYYVLALLSDQPDRRLRMSALAAQARAELSRLSHLMGRLSKRGFVRREPDPRDGRYTLAVLTDAGYEHLAEAAPAHVAWVRELFIDVLDRDELQVLLRCAGKVGARLAEHAKRGSARSGDNGVSA